MPRDAAATKMRILAAAVEEFSAYGYAGARIDRIASSAEANKRSIYVYFHDKDGLFQAALNKVITELNTVVPITEDDLPGYAGRMFDYHLKHPAALRMSMWRHLERPSYGPDAADLYSEKIRAVRRLLPDGQGPPLLPPTDLVVLILGLASSWLTSPGDLLAAGGDDPFSAGRLAQHRKALVEAAQRLVGVGPT